jgi:hypothetical protein
MSITLLSKSITLFCGTDKIPQNIPHIQAECGGCFAEYLLSIPHDIVMDLNNGMRIWTDYAQKSPRSRLWTLRTVREFEWDNIPSFLFFGCVGILRQLLANNGNYFKPFSKIMRSIYAQSLTGTGFAPCYSGGVWMWMDKRNPEMKGIKRDSAALLAQNHLTLYTHPPDHCPPWRATGFRSFWTWIVLEVEPRQRFLFKNHPP